MVSGKSRMIGLVVAYLDNQFYPHVLERLSTALQAEGYHVLVFMASQEADRVDDYLEAHEDVPDVERLADFATAGTPEGAG